MDGLRVFFQSLDSWWGYLFLCVSAMAENLFPPLPGDSFVILSAFLVGRGHLQFLPAYTASTVGSITGFMLLFFAGKYWGRRLFQRGKGRFFSFNHLEKVEGWFERFGFLVIVFNRFLSGFRSIVSFAAGMAGMNTRKVFLLALLSCLIWNGVLMGVGVTVGENWVVIVSHYKRVVLALIVILLSFIWIKTYLQKRKKS